MSTRRQGIFWLLTVPAPCSVCERLSTGILPNCLVWVKGQLECGSESGYLHYQVVVAFSKKESLASVTRLFGPGIHAELTRSEAACAYVHKEETRAGVPFEHGVKPINRSSKIDWESVWAAAITNDILSVPASIRIQSYRALRAIGADYATNSALDTFEDGHTLRFNVPLNQKFNYQSPGSVYGKTRNLYLVIVPDYIRTVATLPANNGSVEANGLLSYTDS